MTLPHLVNILSNLKLSQYLAQHWKYDEMSSRLENKNGDWFGLSMAFQWTIPLTGERGIVINNYGYVLGARIDAVTSGTIVELQAQKNPPSSGQIWLRGTSDEFGYFTLQNPTSQKFLTCNSRTSITIEGTLAVKVFSLGGLFMKQKVYPLVQNVWSG